MIKKLAKGAAGKLFRSPTGQAVGGVLKGVAKKALPLAGGGLDSLGSLGAKIVTSASGDAPDGEAELLSQEDQQFEGAKQFYDAPPIACYLDRGAGAAIRRARTRLPGGGDNPVAVIRVPRERMVGSGIASSVVHEVGHQGAELLDLVPSMRPLLRGLQATDGRDRRAWQLWER